ncbi:MAG: 3-phosphoshikimate 1-carboxyvinyltransferase [Xanthomonadales bacterium]|nr:3-phosphoshikimate 1-carboxyvinyltransferase [Xanthomonadales bacterium]
MSNTIIFKPCPVGLSGELQPPGDKSISHRAAIFSLLAEGESTIHGFLRAEDTMATLSACIDLGAVVTDQAGTLKITGVGLKGLSAPTDGRLDMGNSGTAMRLLAGVLAAQPFDCELYGDKSLSGRPMARIIRPLALMGTEIAAADGCPPIFIAASSGLKPLRYQSPVASAQVKSCLLLAGLCSGVEVSVSEPALSRDHSERMLRAQGAAIEVNGDCVKLSTTTSLAPLNMAIPADISSAAFAIVAGLILPGSEITVQNISINPTRARLLDVLSEMGGNIEIFNTREQGGESVADLRVRSSSLKGIDVPPEWVPGMIDEFPILMIAASLADGVTRVRGAAELRVKESDRISVMADGLGKMGVVVDECADGFDLHGNLDFRFAAADVDACGDHRCAMSYLIAGLVSKAPVRVRGTAAIATSYPNFIADMQNLGAKVQ